MVTMLDCCLALTKPPVCWGEMWFRVTFVERLREDMTAGRRREMDETQFESCERKRVPPTILHNAVAGNSRDYLN